MTGDINVNITITAEAVQAFFALLGIKESREESTKEESKEKESVNLVVHHTSSSSSSERENNNINNTHYDDDVVAIKPTNNHVANESSNNDYVYPPTKEEVTDYVLSKGYTLDVNRFYAYYSRLGWATKTGVSIIKTWKETLDGWMTNGHSNTSTLGPVDKNNREALKATHPFIPTEF